MLALHDFDAFVSKAEEQNSDKVSIIVWNKKWFCC